MIAERILPQFCDDVIQAARAERLLVTELLAAMPCPLHPAIVALPQRRQWPLPVISLRMIVSQVSHWLAWLDGEGIGQSRRRDPAKLRRLPIAVRAPVAGYRMNRMIAVRWLRHHAPVLSEGYRDGFKPWGRRSSSEVASFTTGAYKTPPIPDQALHAMLTGAPFPSRPPRRGCDRRHRGHHEWRDRVPGRPPPASPRRS